MTFTKESLANLTVKLAWAMTFPLVWVGLFTKGWYNFTYTGNSDTSTPAFRNDFSAKYGLFGIDFESQSSGLLSTGYHGWVIANGANPDALTGIHSSRITAILSAVACVLTGVAYYRANKSRSEISVFILGRCSWLAAIDLSLNLTTLGLWGVLVNNPVFLTVCEASGCFVLPGENVTASTVSYTWGLLFVRAVIQSLLLVGIVYLTLAKRASLSFSTTKIGPNRSLEPSAPELVASPNKMAV
ncbi:hypothetical protein VYU27_004094 [Nannochloropsis oceanica]